MLGFVFRGLDADRSGAVTLEEVRPFLEARFRSLDANADNAVTRDEVPRGHRHGGERRGGGGGGGPAPASPANPG
jgi:hypothetical protein